MHQTAPEMVACAVCARQCRQREEEEEEIVENGNNEIALWSIFGMNFFRSFLFRWLLFLHRLFRIIMYYSLSPHIYKKVFSLLVVYRTGPAIQWLYTTFSRTSKMFRFNGMTQVVHVPRRHCSAAESRRRIMSNNEECTMKRAMLSAHAIVDDDDDDNEKK